MIKILSIWDQIKHVKINFSYFPLLFLMWLLENDKLHM